MMLRVSQRLPAPPSASRRRGRAAIGGVLLPPYGGGAGSTSGPDPPCRDRGGDLSPEPQARLLCIPARL